MNLSDSNLYLRVRPGVVLTPVIDYAIHEVDPYFKDLPSQVTSGYRDPADQLRVVREYLLAKQLGERYADAMVGDVSTQVWSEEHHQMVYGWQLGWSALLNAGVIINPPYAAACLLDYFGPTKDGVNRRGHVISQTPHATGCAFNIGGGGNGPADELACITAAIRGGVKSIVNCLLERENNAVHVNARKV